MILTSVCENSEFLSQSDYDLNDVLQLDLSESPLIGTPVANSRRHQLRFDAALAGLGLFWWGHEDGRALG